ncbi:MAG: hypothetical protein ACRD96_04775 [Bryobacteraceae bacterium]
MRFLLAGALVATAMAQNTSLNGPVPGLVYDRESNSVRLMIGLPGSAYLGEALAGNVSAASVSPNGNAALIARGEAVSLLRGAGNVALDGAEGATRFAWNNSGTSAALYNAASGAVQVWTNLDQNPSRGETRNVARLGNPTALAFDGVNVIAGTPSGVWVLGENSAPKQAAQASNPVALAIAGANLYFADAETNQIWEVRDYAGAAAQVLFADGRDGVASPAGLGLFNNNTRLAVANASSVDVFEIASHASLGHVELDFAPTRLEALGNLALLNYGKSGEPLYVLQAAENLQVYFVPAGREQ